MTTAVAGREDPILVSDKAIKKNEKKMARTFEDPNDKTKFKLLYQGNEVTQTTTDSRG